MRVSRDHLGDIRLFVAVAEVGSLTVAAPKFGYSVPAASVRLSKLEKFLRVKLFSRSAKKFVLTEEGQEYLKSCAAALKLIDDAENIIKSGHKYATGKIRISAATDFGRNYLFGWIDEFVRGYPNVSVSLMLDDALSDILQEDVDIAIRFGKPSEECLVIKRLAPNYRVLCASPIYLEEEGTPVTPDDLHKHRFIVLATKNGLLNEYYFERDGVSSSYVVPPHRSWEVNDGELATRWAVAGRGITRKTIWDAIASLQSGALKIVLPEYIVMEEGVFAVRGSNKYLPQRIRVFLDFLEQKFQQELKGVDNYFQLRVG